GESRGTYIAKIQQHMREGLERSLPEWLGEVLHEETGSPRTFERFTGRKDGYVGGIPRRAGWRQYLDFGTPRLAKNVYLIGDSTFPGQSTLATALGGWKAAERIARRL
ncbi:MAG: FAD-dependent oxidoreductase, partial [Planctomycetota bacterium]